MLKSPTWHFTVVIPYIALLAGMLVLPAAVDSRAGGDSLRAAGYQNAGSATEEGAESRARVVSGPTGLPLCAMLETASVYVRTPGRRARDLDATSTAPPNAVIKHSQLRAALLKAVFTVFVSMLALLVVPPSVMAAGKQYEQPDGGGNGYPRRPYLGAPNVVVSDPADYPRPECLENYNPDSFWYSMRPNIFNVAVEPEWDFYNIINTVRPDFTDAVYTVGKGVTVLENGYTFHKINTAATHISTRQLPESLLRYGINDEFEVTLKWPGYLMTTIRDQNTGSQQTTFGSEDIDAGFKYELWQQDNWLPLTALVAGMTLPTGSPGSSANFVEPHFNIVAGWGLRRWLFLKCQTGCDYLHTRNAQVVSPQEGSSTPTFVTVQAAQNSWHESISLLTQWTKRVGAFHEWFMISGTGGGDRSAQHYLDMGIFYYLTPNIQLDARVGRQISNRTDNFFTGAGFSGRW